MLLSCSSGSNIHLSLPSSSTRNGMPHSDGRSKQAHYTFSSCDFFGRLITRITAQNKPPPCRKASCPTAACILSPQIANDAVTIGTTAVLPFYALMVLAPHTKFTKKVMDSTIPIAVLGILYTYTLFLSWRPDILPLLFPPKNYLPELSGLVKLFSNEMSMSSAWIHLLAVDLFTARHIFHDGVKTKTETRHSICFCLLCCPVGILMHEITKAVRRHMEP